MGDCYCTSHCTLRPLFSVTMFKKKPRTKQVNRSVRRIHTKKLWDILIGALRFLHSLWQQSQPHASRPGIRPHCAAQLSKPGFRRYGVWENEFSGSVHWKWMWSNSAVSDHVRPAWRFFFRPDTWGTAAAWNGACHSDFQTEGSLKLLETCGLHGEGKSWCVKQWRDLAVQYVCYMYTPLWRICKGFNEKLLISFILS